MLQPLLFKSYIQTIINSVGSTQYRNFYVSDSETGEVKDVLENGNLSCAIFVSNILYMFSGIHKLISAPHLTVDSTIRDIVSSDWYEISDLRPGAIIKWESIDFGATGWHTHIGFYIDNNEAVSNDYQTCKIARHSYDFEGKRKIEKIYWHDGLDGR